MLISFSHTLTLNRSLSIMLYKLIIIHNSQSIRMVKCHVSACLLLKCFFLLPFNSFVRLSIQIVQLFVQFAFNFFHSFRGDPFGKYNEKISYLYWICICFDANKLTNTYVRATLLYHTPHKHVRKHVATKDILARKKNHQKNRNKLWV